MSTENQVALQNVLLAVLLFIQLATVGIKAMLTYLESRKANEADLPTDKPISTK